MGVMNFSLPAEVPAEGLRELECACVLGGPDNMPYPTEVRVGPGLLSLTRDVDESGPVAAPWPVPGAGLLLTSSASLMEREPPYHLPLELARGKVNQVRGQAADWQAGGLHLPPELAEAIRDATRTFGRAVTRFPEPAAEPEAQNALVLACHAAEKLAQTYAAQVLQLRHQRQPRLDAALACRLGPGVPRGEEAAVVRDAFNTAVVPFPWRDIEVGEGDYRWEAADALLDWAEGQGLRVTGGPLVDFSLSRLPGWVWQWERNRPHFASFVCDYVEVVVKRYQNRVRTWQLSAAGNLALGLALGEDEMLWLALKMAEAVRRIDPSLEVTLGVAQPWGEYLAGQERAHSPFVFADTLLRNGIRLAALDLELVMGVAPRGSYCRDLLAVSRLLDLYAILGVPVQVTLGYPAAAGPDPGAEPGLAVDAGYWRGGFSPEGQADWAEAVAELALAKPYVRAVQWVHVSDAEPHLFPHCGLVGGEGKVRPVVARLQKLRQQHLK
jgi:hypothetical protein